MLLILAIFFRFLITTSQLCSDSNCLICIPLNTCQICNTGYFLKNNACLPCNTDDQINCLLCSTSTNDCVICLSTFFKILSGANACTQCGTGVQANCNTCSSTANECITCSSGYYLDTTTKICYLCGANSHPNCATCSTTDNVCISCSTNYFMKNTGPGGCLPCGTDDQVNCQTCSTATNQCNACHSNYFLKTNQCVLCGTDTQSNCATCSQIIEGCTICQSTFFLKNNQCVACGTDDQINCLICSTSFNECLTCKNGYYLKNGICILCGNADQINCLTCLTNANGCTICNNNYFNKLNQCIICGTDDQINCQTCSATTNQCNVCKSTYFLKGNQCMSCGTDTQTYCATCSQILEGCIVCQSNYFLKNNQCLACGTDDQINCETCSTTTNQCIACKSGYFLKNNQCMVCGTDTQINCATCSQVIEGCTVCQATFFLKSNQCLACGTDDQINCQTCSTSSNQCTACTSIYFLKVNQCVLCGTDTQINCATCSQVMEGCTICQPTFFLKINQCVSCGTDDQVNCLQCSTSLNECLTCSNGFYLKNGQCILCGNGDQINCQTCSPNSNACTACNPTYFLKNGFCLACGTDDQLNCLTCSNIANECSNCSPNYFLKSNQCLICGSSDQINCITCSQTTNECFYCKSSFFLKNNQCAACGTLDQINCAKCSTTSNVCLDCQPNYYLSIGICNSCTNKPNCQVCSTLSDGCQTCQGGYYLDLSLNCQPCSNILNCISCSSTQNICMSCLSPYLLNAGNCLACLDISNFYDSTTNTCKGCSTSCLTCFGLLATQCSSCSAGSYLRSSDNSCQKCDSNCLTCISPGNHCVTCPFSSFKYNNYCFLTCPLGTFGFPPSKECLQTCPVGFYQDVLAYSCASCDPSCVECLGAGPTSCKVCASGKFLNSGLSMCTDCSPGCNACSGISTNCTSCQPLFTLINSQCQAWCDVNCLVCNMPGNCQVCRDGYFLNEDHCSETEKIIITVNEIRNPLFFYFSLSKSWPEFFENITSNINIDFPNLVKNQYSCKIVPPGNDITFGLECSWASQPRGNLSLNFINPPKGANVCCTLEPQSFSIEVKSNDYHAVCSDFVIENCFVLRSITPFLRRTQNQNSINLILDSALPVELSSSLNRFSTLEGNSFQIKNWTLNQKETDPNSFLIGFTTDQPLTRDRLITLKLNVPLDIQYTLGVRFTRENISLIVMEDYNSIDEGKEAMDKIIADNINTVQRIFATFIYFSTCICSNSVHAVKNMALIDSLQIFKFIGVDYPPNILNLFDFEIGKSQIGLEFSLVNPEEDGILSDPYHQYGLSIYFLNNCGAHILFCYFLWLLCLLVTKSGKILLFYYPENNLIAKLNVLLREHLYWSYPLSIYLSNVIFIFLLIGLAIKQPSNSTLRGSTSLFIAAISLPISLWAVCRCYSVIKILRKADKSFGNMHLNIHKDSLNISVPNEHHPSRIYPSSQPIHGENMSNPDFTNTSKASSMHSSPKNRYKGFLFQEIEGSVHILSSKNAANGIKDSESLKEHEVLRESESKVPNINEEKNKQNLEKPSISTNIHNILKGNKDWAPTKVSSLPGTPLKKNENKPTNTKRNSLTFGLENSFANKQSKLSQFGEKITKRSKTSIGANIGKDKEIVIYDITDQIDETENDNTCSNTTNNASNPMIIPIRGSKNNIESELDLNGKMAPKVPVENQYIPILTNQKDLIAVKIFKGIHQILKAIKFFYKLSITDFNEYEVTYGLFHREYKPNMWVTHYFFFFELLRQMFIATVILSSEYYLLIRSILIATINILFLLGTIIFRPYKSLKLLFQSTLNEIAVSLCSLVVLVLCTLNGHDSEEKALKIKIGWIFVASNGVLVYSSFLLSAIDTMVIILRFLKNTFKRSSKVLSETFQGKLY